MNPLLRRLDIDDARLFVYTPVRTLGIDVHSREWAAGRSGSAALQHDSLPPVVLVAGLGVSSRYWVPLARRLAERRDVLAPDLPGFGRTRRVPTSRWPAGPSPREQADHLLAWMDARGIHRALLCGHSVGCQVVADLAARFPGRVERLVLAGPTYEAGKRSMPRQIARLAAGGLFEIPWLHVVLALEYGSAGLPRVVQQAARSLPDPIELKLPLIESPTLVLRGAHDPIVPRAWAQKLAALLPRGGLVEVGRVGHALQFSAPDATAEVIGKFLDGELDGRLGTNGSGADGTVIAAEVTHRRRGPLASPPQPISARAHGLIGAAFAGVTVALMTHPRYGPRTRRTLAAAAAINATTSLLTDFEFGAVRKLPMATHATLDFAVGTQLVMLALTTQRGERGRWATAFIGASQVAVALLTHAPTGPARWIATTTAAKRPSLVGQHH